MNTIFRALVLFAFSLSLAACASTKFTAVWVDEKYKGESIDNIMVIGVAENATNRRLYEDMFVSQLQGEGLTAVASYKFIPGNIEITREAVEKVIKGKDIDAIIATHLIGIDKKTVYHQPTTHVTRSRYSDVRYHGSMYNYFPPVYSYVHSPGYYTTHKNVKLETNLYDASNGNLSWSAQSSSFSPTSAKDIIKPLISNIIDDLQDRGMIVDPGKSRAVKPGKY